MNYSYELHRHPDPEFPVIFHLDTISSKSESGYLHWHEGTELLYCIEGSGVAILNDERIRMTPGDLVIINTGYLHTIYSETGCRYYCLITAPEVFHGTGLPVNEGGLQSLVKDSGAARIMGMIVDEIQEKQQYHRTAVRNGILLLYTYLCRRYRQEGSAQNPSGNDSRLELVKAVLSYIRHNFARQISLEQISRQVGFSRDYVCHVFKQVTGQTVVSYLNFVRCANAKTLMLSAGCNVGESARQSGYNNLSYFSKTYKAIMGEAPSATYAQRQGSG